MFILVGSLFGAAYFGYTAANILAVPIWAIVCTIWFLGSNKDVLKYSRKVAFGQESSPSPWSYFTAFLIFVAIATVLTGVQVGLYFIAEKFS